ESAYGQPGASPSYWHARCIPTLWTEERVWCSACCPRRRRTEADQKNRGGQKQGSRQPDQAGKKQGTTAHGAGQRSDQDKREDQMSNPDDANRQPTNEQR